MLTLLIILGTGLVECLIVWLGYKYGYFVPKKRRKVGIIR